MGALYRQTADAWAAVNIGAPAEGRTFQDVDPFVRTLFGPSSPIPLVFSADHAPLDAQHFNLAKGAPVVLSSIRVRGGVRACVMVGRGWRRGRWGVVACLRVGGVFVMSDEWEWVDGGKNGGMNGDEWGGKRR